MAKAHSLGAAGIHEVEVNDHQWSAEVDDEALARVLQWRGATGATALTARPPSLEELFIQHYATHTSTRESGQEARR